jgi:Pyridine nucleotide-disulphide oxidoreductase, dimerisation domain
LRAARSSPHVSVDDFRVVHANLSGGNRVTTGRQVPYCLFTDPELARIGLSETEAKAQGIPYYLFKVPMDSNLRARTLSETRGFLKALVQTDSDRIRGFTAFGAGAGEILGAVQFAMFAGLPYTALRDAVVTHPTLVESLIPLFSSTAERAWRCRSDHHVGGMISTTIRELLAGQACCLRYEVITLGHAGRPRSRNSVMFDGGFVIAHLFK